VDVVVTTDDDDRLATTHHLSLSSRCSPKHDGSRVLFFYSCICILSHPSCDDDADDYILLTYTSLTVMSISDCIVRRTLRTQLWCSDLAGDQFCPKMVYNTLPSIQKELESGVALVGTIGCDEYQYYTIDGNSYMALSSMMLMMYHL